MPQENKQFIDILDEEFSRIRSEQNSQEGYRTVAEMAGYLEVDPALLSRYRVGDRPVSRRSAYQFALKFSPESEEHRKVLVQRLLTARRIQTEEEITVQKWFEKRGHPGFFMAVLFYEAPVLSSTNNELVEAVACAIARGLNYAVIFPFSVKEMSNPRLSQPIRSYLGKVWEGVKDLYVTLLTRALVDAADDWSGKIDTPLGKKQLIEELEATAKRIKIFKLRDDEACSEKTIPAIGFRLFYCRDHAFPAADPELWQWNSAPSGDRMLQKPASASEIAAVEALLYPIPHQFKKAAAEKPDDENRALPDDKELEEFLDSDLSADLDAKPVEPVRWEVESAEPTKLSVLINKTVSDMEKLSTLKLVKGESK